MLFTSLVFLAFILAVFIVYPRLPHRGQNLFLILSSYVFYAYWDWRFIFLLLSLTVINFFIGQNIGKSVTPGKRKLLVILATICNLGVLCFFKYFNFFIESASSLLSVFGLNPNLPLLQIILPLGISFYTFQTMTYTLDIYSGKLEPTKSFADFSLFVSFFPQLLAGPIERAANMLPQISTPRLITREQVLTGLNLILLGYFKKVAIADTLAPIADRIFKSPELMTSSELWTGVYAFTIQIYCDFSGYTDIARGIALILGFKIVENFNAPYLSRNITEFWRKWHISLSSWLRDYLYIPLGGNRSGRIRSYISVLITFLLCGLWHGAAWTFVIWGLLHGLYLVAHRIILKGNKLNVAWQATFSGRIVEIFKILLTFHIVALTWILFKSQTLSIALKYFTGLFHLQQFTGISIPVVFAGLLVLALDLTHTWLKSDTWLTERNNKHTAIRYAIAQMLFISIIASAIAHTGTITPFIYFQF